MLLNIYIMKNFTLREVYFGLSETSCESTVKSHKNNPLSPVGHWLWKKEKIQWGEVQGGLSAGAAIAFLNALRKEPQEEGWVVVFGTDAIEDALLNGMIEEG